MRRIFIIIILKDFIKMESKSSSILKSGTNNNMQHVDSKVTSNHHTNTSSQYYLKAGLDKKSSGVAS